MKQILLATVLASSSLLGFYAQNTSNIVVFAQDPKPFYAIVNGIKQNAEPQTNVKITNLTNPSCNIKIVFADGTPDLNKTTWFETMGKEATFRIVNTKKGYKLRYFGEIDITNSVENTQQAVISYHTEEIQPVSVQPVNETVTVTEQVVTTTNSTPTVGVTTNSNPTSVQSENVNVGIDLGGFGVSMNVNVNETNGSANSTTIANNVDYSTTTTTTTTTTSSSSSGFGQLENQINTQEEAVAPIVYVTGYTGRIGCPIPESSINSIKSSVEEENFSNDKMNLAKQATKNRCITVSQVREIMSAFDFEDKKLEFAKYAYDRTYDIDNYYMINKDFDFSSNKESLNKYVESK